MRIVCIGGGPAGLYFALLMKKADPAHRITVYERNGPDDTFGFGVVFSDATLGKLGDADAESYAEIRRHFAHWDAIDTHVGGEVIRSVGHGFSGLERLTLLRILQRRCEAVGVELVYHHEVADVGAIDADLILLADGVASGARERLAEAFGPAIDVRPNKFVWLGTTFPFEAFTFYFVQNEHGLFRVHAYRYQESGSTFIVECTAGTWKRAGMDHADEDATIAYLEQVFARELAGHRLLKNRSIWRSFPTVTNRRWHHRNMVLVGDAAHTAHFSIGSGTKLAMEDCIALADALGREPELAAALAAYEQARRPEVESLQRAAQVSLEWFENTERYLGLEPLQFTYSLMTRSLRVSHDSMRRRDPDLVRRTEAWFAARAAAAAGLPEPAGEPPPPVRAPLRVGGTLLSGRIVGQGGVGADIAARAPRLEAGPGGLDPDHAVARARELARCGAELIVVAPAASAAPARRLAVAAVADRIRHEVGVAVLLEGGIRSEDDANGVLLAGRADLVALDPA